MKKINGKAVVMALALSMALMNGCASGSAADSALTVKNAVYDGSVSFLGPEGTYTQEACETFFGKSGDFSPYATVSDAVQALVDGETKYAVIPQENTIGGAVIDYVDVLINEDRVSVVGEVELTINQNLLVLPGTKLDDIKTVYSHKQGITQGKEWLAENLPDAEVIEASSTAEGAKMVAESGDKSVAAIASAGCTAVYGLEILAPNIQNNDKNKTRFYVLSCDEPEESVSDRLAFVASGNAMDLPLLMAALEQEKMTLVSIHDRPMKTELGQYRYVIECMDGSHEKYDKITKKNSNFEYRYLGSFPVK